MTEERQKKIEKRVKDIRKAIANGESLDNVENMILDMIAIVMIQSHEDGVHEERERERNSKG